MRGRPLLGAISGMFLGLFVGLDLVMFKVLALGSSTILVAPAIGAFLGVVFGLLPPFGRHRAGTVRTPSAQPGE